MTEHVHTADCFVEGTQVCGMELRARPPITPAAAVELARHSRQLTQMPSLNTPEVLMSGDDLLKFLELATADRRRYSPIPRQVQGNFFPKLPLLTDRQEVDARAGVCPTCCNHTLMDMGAGEGLRFMGCCACLAVVVLDSRPSDRLMMTTNGPRPGTAHLAQKVKLAMRMYDEQGGLATGYCVKGDRCVCGGDTERVRSHCSRWVKA
jgi:hypothetical protein